MEKICLCLIILCSFGCTNIVTPGQKIEQTKTDANVIVAIAASINDNTEADKVWAVGKCDNCNGSGKTGDGFENCNICNGDGQISQADADKANNVAAAMVEEIADKDEIEFVTLAEAREKSKSDKLPVWIHFSKSKDCRVCKLIEVNVFPDPKVIEASKKFVCVTVDCGTDGEDPKITKLLSDFRVDRRQGLPQDLFLLPDWKQIEKPMVSRSPITAQGYVIHLHNWAEYLTKR